MHKKDRWHKVDTRKRVPLWKWLIVILLVLAMPLFFSFYKKAQLQQTIQVMNQAQPNQ